MDEISLEACMPQGLSCEQYVEALQATVEEYSDLMFAEVVEFFRPTVNYWNKIPAGWREEWNKDPASPQIQELMSLNPGQFNASWPDNLRLLSETCAKLALKRTLPRKVDIPELDNVFTQGMKEKKQYEVSVMAKLISDLSKQQNISTVVDLGAGQAYLSHILAYHYRLNVLAVDNDELQTAGAFKRQKIIEQRILRRSAQKGEQPRLGIVQQLNADIQASGWNDQVQQALDQLLKQDHSRPSSPSPSTSPSAVAVAAQVAFSATKIRKSQSVPLSLDESAPSTSSKRLTASTNALALALSSISQSSRKSFKFSSKDRLLASVGLSSPSPVEPEPVMPKPSSRPPSPLSENNASGQSLLSVPTQQSPREFLEKAASYEDVYVISQTVDRQLFDRQREEKRRMQPLPILEITDTTLTDSASTFPSTDSFASAQRWLLCGLHTCGDLAPSTLRKFVHGNATALVNVGCCYQWVTEEKDVLDHVQITPSRDVTNPNHHWSHLTTTPDQPGFPMSQFLKRSKAKLGRKARNLANQSLDRWPETKIELENLFNRHFYRAAIQIVLDEEQVQPPSTDDVTDELWTPIIGHIPNDAYTSFESYAQAVISKLGVTDQVSMDVVTEVYNRLLPLKSQMAIFWRLRSELATVVESLLLMDRYLYLKENGLQVNLFPLFDPAISPRNLTLVAVRPN